MVNMINAINEPTILISFAGFLVIFLFCIGILQLRRRLILKKEVLERIRAGGEVVDRSYEGSLPETERSAPKNTIFNVFIKLGNRLSSEKSEDDSIKRMRFLKAGIRNPKAGANFMGSQMFSCGTFFGNFSSAPDFCFCGFERSVDHRPGCFYTFFGLLSPRHLASTENREKARKVTESLTRCARSDGGLCGGWNGAG